MTAATGQPVPRQATARDVAAPQEDRADDARPPLRVDLVRGFRAELDGRDLGPRELGGTKPRLVLVALVLAHGAPVSKARLVDMLWGEAPPANAVSVLESYVSVLRSRLGGGAKRRVIATVPNGYVLPRDAVRSDLDEAHRLLRRSGVACPVEQLTLLRQALQVLDGPLLPEEAATGWLDDARTHHDGRVAALRRRMLRTAADAGLWEQALALGGDCVHRDPLDEVAWEVVVRAHVALGHPVEALRAFDRCRDALRRHLGCAPGPALQRALDDVLAATAADDDDLGDLLHSVVALRQHVAGRPRPHQRRVLQAACRAIAGLTSA